MKSISFLKVFLIVFVFVVSCSPGGDGEEESVNTPNPVTNPSGNPNPSTSDPPGSFSLSFPENNEICQDGAAIANQPDKWLINFQWTASSNANNYEITVVESESGTQISNIETSSTNQYVEVDKGVLYQWSVKAINEDGEYTSPEWSFYSKGVGVGNYVPYPAYNIVFEFDTNNDILTLRWDAADEDGDDLTFDVSLYENGNEVYSVMNLDSQEITAIPVFVGATYQARITVTDGISSSTKLSDEVQY